jgi:2-phosphoglycerate kinase
MTKLYIQDPYDEDAPTPFLRGILTRSLCNIGLSFDRAYSVATKVRDTLAPTPKLTTDELRAIVVKRLVNEQVAEKLVERYRNPVRHQIHATIWVKRTDNHLVTPFSIHQHSRHMHASGLQPQIASSVTNQLFQHLHNKHLTEIDSNTLGRLTCSILRNHVGESAVDQYLTWTHFTRSGKPIYILIGGATGSGKSTIATEIAHRFGIVRTQSTDMLREVMRVMVPEALMPALHTSSFEAWRTHPRFAEGDSSAATTDEIVSGYLMQSKEVAVPADAIILRASRENVSLVLEGIHNHPARMREIAEREEGVVIPLMLTVIKRKELRKRISGRGREREHRRAKRYLEHFDEIWKLQNFLLDEAEQSNIPIIHNDNQEDTIEQVIIAINKVLSARFAITEEALFPE